MKKVSVSTATVIKEIAPLYGLSEMEAQMIVKWEDGQPVDDETPKGKIADSLFERGFFDIAWDCDGLFPLKKTELAERFCAAVKARKETRIFFNLGCDLFPEMANIAI